MEFNDNYPSYETMYQHSDAEGKPKRKKLWRVFWIMLGITLLELAIGTYASKMGLLNEHRGSTATLKIIFVFLTLLKAAYIVLEFMHLGHETKAFKWTILAPYSIFIGYLVFIILVEGTYTGYPENKTKLWPGFLEQKNVIIEELKSGHHGGGESHETKTEKPAAEHH